MQTSLRAKSRRAKKAVRQGMNVGMEFFLGKMKKEQMSGRPYLKTHSGAAGLKGSWFVKSGFLPGVIVSKLATSSIYAAIHQFGGIIRPKTQDYLTFKIGNQWVRTDKVKIPKRLQLFESFKKEGNDILSRHIAKALIRAFK